MTGMLLCIDCVLCALDFIVISSLRRFLVDFLLACRNKKYVKKIHTEQLLINRITLDYIQPLLQKNVSIFRRYQKLYMVILYTILPQYIILLISNFLIGMNSLYILALFAIIKLIIALVIRFQTDSLLISRYRKTGNS